MSKLEVDKIDPQSGTNLELGTSGDTITVPTGVTLDASNATTTLPANVVTTDGTQTLTNKSIAATQLTGTVATSNLGTGTADATTFLRGDQTYASATPAADSITTSQLAYNPNPFRNIIINGDMSIAQRGTSTTGVTTTDGYYACDRWRTQTDTGTWTISQSTDVPSGQGFAYSMKLDCTSAGTSNADEVALKQRIEGQNLQYLKYGTSSAESLTCSFWIKTNKTGTYSAVFNNLNSSQERIISFDYTVNSANTWEKKTITLPGDTVRSIDNTNEEEFSLNLYFSAAFGTGVTNTWQNYSANFLSSGNLAGLGGSTDDEVYVTGVQIEVGTSASDFEFLPYDVNSRRCYRYYYRINFGSGLKYVGFGQVDNDNLNIPAICNIFPEQMRIAPTALEQSGTASHYKVREAGTYSCTAVPTFNTASTWNASVTFKRQNITSSDGFAQGELLKCGGESGYLGWSAEL